MPDLTPNIPGPCGQNEPSIQAVRHVPSIQAVHLEPSIQAVIFDLDGTLLDTLADLAQAGNQVLLAHGKTAAPIEAYKQYVGDGARNLIIRAFAAAGQQLAASDPLLDQLAAEFSQAYDACWAMQTKPYPGVRTMLADLSNLGVELMILSNKPDDFTQKIVGHFFADIRFAAVCGKQTGWPLKPDPSLALDMCRRNGIEAGWTVFVGDSGSDMQTARRGHFMPIGVLWGFRSADELTANGATYLFREPEQLADWLAGHADTNLIRPINLHDQKGGTHDKPVD